MAASALLKYVHYPLKNAWRGIKLITAIKHSKLQRKIFLETTTSDNSPFLGTAISLRLWQQ